MAVIGVTEQTNINISSLSYNQPSAESLITPKVTPDELHNIVAGGYLKITSTMAGQIIPNNSYINTTTISAPAPTISTEAPK